MPPGGGIKAPATVPMELTTCAALPKVGFFIAALLFLRNDILPSITFSFFLGYRFFLLAVFVRVPEALFKVLATW